MEFRIESVKKRVVRLATRSDYKAKRVMQARGLETAIKRAAHQQQRNVYVVSTKSFIAVGRNITHPVLNLDAQWLLRRARS